jgi:hypothetical protein
LNLSWLSFRCIGIPISIGVFAIANAQWTANHIHPAGVSGSHLFGGSGGKQVGYVTISGRHSASLWSGTASSWLSLDPPGANFSFAYETDGGQQVGTTYFSGRYRASLWSGTAATWVDLSPAGALSSHGWGIGDGQQVGYVEFPAFAHAALWSGTAASYVDLNPPGIYSSEAFAASGGQQVGRVDNSAALWTGTASSCISLQPGFGDGSIAYGVRNGCQVGVVFAAGRQHASLWRGSPASWVNLDPIGSVSESVAEGVWGEQQVGYVYRSPRLRATLWSGTADTMLDLHALLESQYISSDARAIYVEGDRTFIVGTAYNNSANNDWAILWTCENNLVPSSLSLYRGILVSGGLSALGQSDDLRLVVARGITLSSQESPIALRVDATSPFGGVTAMSMRLEAQVSTAGLQQAIDLYDFAADEWVTVDARSASPNTDTVVNVTAPNQNRFIQPGTRTMRAQIRYRQVGPVQISNWRAKIDQVQWRLTP